MSEPRNLRVYHSNFAVIVCGAASGLSLGVAMAMRDHLLPWIIFGMKIGVLLNAHAKPQEPRA